MKNIADNEYNEILEIVKNNPKLFGRILHSKKFSYLLNWINEQVPLLSSPFYTLGTKLNWIFSKRTAFPICKHCHKSNKYLRKNVGVFDVYSDYCCKACFNSSDYHKQKVEQTCIQKYGKKSYFQTSEFRNDFEHICLEKYGAKNPFASTEIKQKIKNTCLNKYGVENPMQLSCISAKQQQTCLEKFGMKFYTQTQMYHDSQMKHNNEQYGCNHYMKFVAYQLMLNNEYDSPNFPISFLDSIDNIEKTELEFKCKKCHSIFTAVHHDGFHNRCPKCYPKEKTRSSTEIEIVKYLKYQMSFQLVENNRTIISPYELDIYIPEKKLAIEYDGLFWHSDNDGIDINYHLHKTELCEKHGIQLIHIFENEWLTKQDIVKSRLKNLLGIYDKIIYARKCIIKQIDSKTSKDFQEQNHIQGAVNSSINLGLFHHDELVSLMTFSKTRFSKKYEWELVRFCNKLGYHIPGAAGKLLKYFERNYHPKSLISYADRRWSQGKLYKVLSFQLDHISAPNYWYFKTRYSLESRVKYQKHKLSKLLKKFDPTKSELENMKDNSYRRIFDCGNFVFIKLY